MLGSSSSFIVVFIGMGSIVIVVVIRKKEGSMVLGLGLEPSSQGPEPCVLPLHYPRLSVISYDLATVCRRMSVVRH